MLKKGILKFTVDIRLVNGLTSIETVKARFMHVSKEGILLLHNGNRKKPVFAANVDRWLNCRVLEEDTEDFPSGKNLP